MYRVPSRRRSFFSVNRIYLHFFCHCNSARGCLCSDLTTPKLHSLFNHNCLHITAYFLTLHSHPPAPCLHIFLTDFTQSLQFGFIIENCSVQRYRGGAGSLSVTQVRYLWPPATSTSLFHGWQRECQSSSSSGDLWPAAALAAHDPHSWVSDVVSLLAETYLATQHQLKVGQRRSRSKSGVNTKWGKDGLERQIAREIE